MNCFRYGIYLIMIVCISFSTFSQMSSDIPVSGLDPDSGVLSTLAVPDIVKITKFDGVIKTKVEKRVLN